MTIYESIFVVELFEFTALLLKIDQEWVFIWHSELEDHLYIRLKYFRMHILKFEWKYSDLFLLYHFCILKETLNTLDQEIFSIEIFRYFYL